jgi:two-component system, OmpR family, response regulator
MWWYLRGILRRFRGRRVVMGDPARILVVDDDRSVRDELVSVLRDAGYPTASCGSVSAGVEVARTFRPDLVVLEMVLGGGVVGGDWVQRMRAEGDPLLLFVTRDPTVATRLAAFEAGADDYVVKPFVFVELLAQIRALLRRGGRVLSLVSQVGSLLVDVPAHRVLFAGEEVQLGPTDFLLLSVLARHAGQVLSKARLMELVWGDDVVAENLVEAHMSTLRRQLGPDAARMIETVRGVGYMLRDPGLESERPHGS